MRVGPWSRKVAYEQVAEERGGMGGAFQAGDKVHTHSALQYLSKLRHRVHGRENDRKCARQMNSRRSLCHVGECELYPGW